MSTPQQLASLEGQQYLVLRPTSAVADRYAEEQRAALDLTDLPHPHTGHVTLRGFYEPTRRTELTALIREWAAVQPPIEIIAEAVDAFPTPWQILILRLARTPSLVSAYASLTEMLVASDLRRLGELDLDDWTFHMSLVYGKTLPSDQWNAIEAARTRDVTQPAFETAIETAVEAELAWYSNGEEHREIIPLG